MFPPLPLILLADPILVSAGSDVLHPVLVVQIPLDGFAEPVSAKQEGDLPSEGRRTRDEGGYGSYELGA